jgi:hypothetical protein
VLFVFSFASFLQSLVWFTFSSVPKVAKEYYPGTARTTHDTRHAAPAAFVPHELVR